MSQQLIYLGCKSSITDRAVIALLIRLGIRVTEISIGVAVTSASFFLRSFSIVTKCSYSILALLCYDWLTCLIREITLVWNKSNKRTWAFLVYFLSRYPFLVHNVLSISTISPLSVRVSVPISASRRIA